MTTRVRILTLNTGRNQGEYDRRIELIIQGLRNANADIVLLQECFADDNGEADAARSIAMALGMDHVAHPSRRKLRAWRGGQVMSSVNLAVLAKQPFEFAQLYALTHADADGERSAQVVGLEIAGRRAVVVNTHLTFLTGDAGQALRREQLREVFAIVAAYDASLRIVGGDLNTTLDGPVFTKATTDWRIDFGPVALRTLKPTLLGGLGYDVSSPSAVDHVVLVHAANERPAARIVNRETLLDQKNGELIASDHAAVCVTLEIV